MRRTPAHHRPTPVRLVLGAALLLSTLASPIRPAAALAVAQTDDGLVDDGSYVSPQFDYEVTWDEPWAADESGTRSRDGRDDVLTLRDKADLPLIVAGVVTDLLPAERLDVIVADRTDGDPDLQVALGADNDDAFATALLSYEDDGVAVHEFVEISEGEAGEWLLVVDLRVPVEDLADAFETTGVVEIDGDPAFQNDPADLLGEADDDDDTERRRPSVPTVVPEDEDPAEEEPTEEANDDEPADESTGDAEGVEGDTYTSPNFDYSVTWDEDVWEVDETTIRDDYDVILLLAPASSLSLTATTDFGGDVAGCLEDVSAFLADGDESVDLVVDDVDILEDEDGEPIEGESDGRAFVANEYTGTFEGEDVSFIYYLECRTIVEDEADLIFIHFVLQPDDYADEAEAREGLEFTFPEGADEAPAPDARETPTPEDEETADPTEESEDPEPTEPPTDDETPTADDETAFESETYGFTLTWDGETWVEEDRSADAVSLGHDSSTLTVSGIEDYDGNALTCVQGEVDTLRGQPGVIRIEPELGDDGRRVSGGDAERFFALYRITATDGTFDGTSGVLLYQECRTLVENDAVLIVQHLVFEPEAYATERPLAEAVIESIEIP